MTGPDPLMCTLGTRLLLRTPPPPQLRSGILMCGFVVISIVLETATELLREESHNESG